MNIRFYFYELKSAYGHPASLSRTSVSEGTTSGVKLQFNKYLLSALDTDFSENRHGDVDEALAAVEKIECGQLDHFETGGQGFYHHITLSRVRFEHSIFGECPEWPIWCCTLAQYKAALQGYRQFLDMPKSIDSELIVELPDGQPSCD